jgi:CubicO group peptidase (beta-lactamase class C family)
MKKRRSAGAVVIFILLFCMIASPVSAVESLTVIEMYREKIPALMAEQGIPGLAVAVVDENRVLWAEGFGQTGRDRKTPVGIHTVFSIQSATKTITATAVMKAVHEGLLDLDEPITTYLPGFTVNSIFEEHPEKKITLRHLLSHTAGFTHEAPLGNNFDLAPVRFEEHIASISQSWLRFPIGSGYAYSNLGIDLAGYILQAVSGRTFAQYIEEELFQPLGMLESIVEPERVASHTDSAVGHALPFPQLPLEIPMLAAGGVYASVHDMALFVQYHLSRGAGRNGSLPDPALLEEMYSVPAEIDGASARYALGIGRSQREALGHCDILFHGGGGFGFLSDMAWYPELGIGVILLTNSSGHSLQGTLALEILDAFVLEPDSVYHRRLMSLPDKTPVPVDASHAGVPGNLPALINELALPFDTAARERWNGYTGTYRLTVWGVFDPFSGGMVVREEDGNLYLDSFLDGRVFQLTEVLPGLLFAENGEALDFRGSTPTWRNIKMSKIGTGPSPRENIFLAACSLIFLSLLLTYSLRGLVRLLRRTAAPVFSPWARFAAVIATITALAGLLSIGLTRVIPLVIYAGFLGHLELPLWQKAALHMPLAYTVAAAAAAAMVIPVWLKRWWTLRERVFYAIFVLAAAVLVFLLSYWQIIGPRIGG